MRWRPRVDSHDAWAFVAPVDSSVVAAAGEVELGRARCDTRLAHLLLDAGVDVIDPSLALRALHLHRAEARDGLHYSVKATVPGSIASVPLSM